MALESVHELTAGLRQPVYVQSEEYQKQKAEGIVKRNNQKKINPNNTLDPPDPINPVPQRNRQRNRPPRDQPPCLVHQHTGHTTDKCPQILMKLGYCVDAIYGRECSRPYCRYEHTIPHLDTSTPEFQEAAQAALVAHTEVAAARSGKAEAALLAMQATPPPPIGKGTIDPPEDPSEGAAPAEQEEHPARKDKRGVTSDQAVIGYGLTSTGRRLLGFDDDD